MNASVILPQAIDRRSTRYIITSPWIYFAGLVFGLTFLSISPYLLSKNDYAITAFPTIIARMKSFMGKTVPLLMQTNLNKQTVVQCIGPLYNQSCLYRNLYYKNGKFLILIVNGTKLPNLTIRHHWRTPADLVPDRKEFESYTQLENFVRDASPIVISNLTLYFYQLWSFNIAHALFDGLYPAFVAFLRFSPPRLYPFRLLTTFLGCETCWVTWVCGNFSGLGVMNLKNLERDSSTKLYVFDAIIMGSANMCQRCLTSDLQLPGSIELDASRLFRDRMYAAYGVCQPITREKSSLQHRKSDDILTAYIVDNKRYTNADRKELYAAIEEINKNTDMLLNRTGNKSYEKGAYLVRATYLNYNQINPTAKMSRRCADRKQVASDKLAIQLDILRTMDIHVTGPGTGQFYQTFLSDGSVTINLGGVGTMKEGNRSIHYTKFMEQYITSGTPYLKGLFYPINERTAGIKKQRMMELIYNASKLIMDGFHIPVNPRENLATDGQLFTELCERDKEFCTAFTVRKLTGEFRCMDSWPELVVHEDDVWGDNGKKNICPLNRTLLHELRIKYGIYH